jgi:hypothetical protein
VFTDAAAASGYAHEFGKTLAKHPFFARIAVPKGQNAYGLHNLALELFELFSEVFFIVGGVVTEQETKNGLAEDFNDGEEFKRFLQELITDGRIDGAMRGMAWIVIRGGVGPLNDKQAFVFKRDLIDQYDTRCKRCQCDIPWDEVITAQMFNKGYCGGCAYKLDSMWS